MRPSRRASAASSSSSLSESVRARPPATARYSDGRISSSPALMTSPCRCSSASRRRLARRARPTGYRPVKLMCTGCERPVAARPRARLACAGDARRRPDPVLLELFEEAGRNVQRAAALLRDLLARVPRRSRARARRSSRASTRATGSPTRSSAGSPSAAPSAATWTPPTCTRSTRRARRHRRLRRGGRRPARPLRRRGADGAGRGDRRACWSTAAERGRRRACASCATACDLGPRLVEIHRLENEADQIVRARGRVSCSRRGSTR